ncbi:hypothetical protein [Methylobacterium sp. 37f]|uniref:hypothetical protein n=1 Tax=Methylobacterium sp. 37f TaxID=2817058 RepID=UPI001FFDBF4C|nr:hypothetical protein [Methylobacterium sp. 37f]MCK2055259.1 hypothetical protein [Methylobacterium sp. 37f]
MRQVDIEDLARDAAAQAERLVAEHAGPPADREARLTALFAEWLAVPTKRGVRNYRRRHARRMASTGG